MGTHPGQRWCWNDRQAETSSMKKFFRLLRYGLPYSLQWVPGVLLLAAVGVLDTFRTLLFQPIFDQVLRPDAPEGPITLGLPQQPVALRPENDGSPLPPHAQRMDCGGVCAGGLHHREGALRLPRDLPGQLRRLRHDHRPAQSSLRSHPAPFIQLLSQARHRNHPLHAHQRCGSRADGRQFGDRRVSAAVLHVYCWAVFS